MMSLSEDQAAKIMAKLDPKEVESLSLEIASLGRFSSADQEEAILAFADANPQALGGSIGGLTVAFEPEQQHRRCFGR